FWENVRCVRNAVNNALEVQRKAGHIGSALEASVSLFCGPALRQQLEMFGDELRFILITSGAEVLSLADAVDAVTTDVPELLVKVVPLKDPKCVRCWHRRADVGRSPAHPELCERCVENVEGQGEVRHYA